MTLAVLKKKKKAARGVRFKSKQVLNFAQVKEEFEYRAWPQSQGQQRFRGHMESTEVLIISENS